VGNSGALTLLAPSDGRVFFIVPAGDFAIVTTTESPARAGPEDARAGRGDVEYLLAAANHYLPAARLTPDDVVSAWAGIRPLAAPSAKDALTSASREHSIAEAQPSLYVVTGGKLTTYRAMAEEVVDLLATRLIPHRSHAVTQRVPLPGGELHDVASAISSVRRVVSDERMAQRLVFAYGARWPRLFGPAPDLRPLDVHAAYLLTEATHAVERELAVTLSDILIRRVPLAFERSDHGLGAAALIASQLAPGFGWDSDDIRGALTRYEAAIERQFAIDAG
jgi:glycerol-3-phosphate dehydrogenase